MWGSPEVCDDAEPLEAGDQHAADRAVFCRSQFWPRQEAHLAASLQRNHGIRCFVSGDQIAGTRSWHLLAVAKEQLLVQNSSAKIAGALL